jgi:hypothetical protein
MSADHQTLIAEALGRDRMTPYEDGEGGWLFRHATTTEQAAALLDSPEFAAVLADVRAGAWDEGYAHGVVDQATSQDWTGGATPPCRANPYRADREGER